MTEETTAGEAALEATGSGAHPSNARQHDGVVLRTPGPWSPSVIALLRHLEAVGFQGAPRVVGSGFADDGRETVTFVPGSSPQPHPWGDEAFVNIGEMFRDLHAATRAFEPPVNAVWKPWFGRHLPGSDPVIGHCDTGPWNIIARDGLPVALIDWEFAGPVHALWELAQSAWLNAQLHDDDLAERVGLPDAETRATQLCHILDGYGLSLRDREDFVNRMIEFAIYSAREEAVAYNVTPETVGAQSPRGYPVLWGITWRTRSAAWMLRNRRLLQRAIAH